MNNLAASPAQLGPLFADGDQSLWIVSALCFVALIATFWKMKGGFGPQNLRAIGIVFIASLVAILSLVRASDLATTMGILGAIVGYLFGSQRSPDRESAEGSSVDAQGAMFGHGAKVAGRDINETLNRIVGDIDQIKDSVIHMTQSSSGRSADFLFLSNYQDEGEPVSGIAENMRELGQEGWEPVVIFPSYDRRGLISLFRRSSGDPADHAPAIGNVYHGTGMTKLA